ncbi:MAG TPA: LytTR family DNA-binding domain-containing protein [Bacteroidia bacterium]|nr:LytTR family DNA-binding domain-containing protein [Bacteroidia bacterium]
MKAIIVEDESLSALHLKNLLHKTFPEIEIVAVLDTVKSTVKFLNQKPDLNLIFLDVHLADGLSFEIFQQSEVLQPVIFTTAFDEYAIKAFKVNSIDYLLKPIGLTELKQAINKFNSHYPSPVSNEIKHHIAYEMMQKSTKTRFIVKMGESLSSIKIENIAFFNAEDGLVLLVTKEGKRYPIDYTLEALETILNEEIFFRINRKMMINIDQINQVQTYFNGRLKINLKTTTIDDCIVSRERVNDFKQWLDK